MIIQMKKAQIVVLKEDREELLKNLQKNEVLMLISSAEETTPLDVSFEDETLKRTESSLDILKRFREKKGFVREEFIVDYDYFVAENPRRLELLDLVEVTDQRIADLESLNEELEAEASYYKPWAKLDLKLNELDNPKYAKVHTGIIDNLNLEKVENAINSVGGDLELIIQTRRETSLIFACYVEDEQELLQRLNNLGLNFVDLPRLDLTPKEIIVENSRKIEENFKIISELNNELMEYSKEANEILLLIDKLESNKELKTAPLAETNATVYLVGWVREDRVDHLKATIAETTEVYDLLLLDPVEGEVVPTITENNKFVSAFEPITNMFSVPSVNDVDPNPVMSFWYWMIFGMMMGDVGYGIVLSILMVVMIKAMKPKGNTLKIMKMFFYGGFATVIWGLVFNSFFGYGIFEKTLLSPIDNIIEYLILSLIIGGLHIISGYLVKAYKDFKDGRFVDGLLDNFPWIFLLVGIGLMFIPAVSQVGIALLITAVALIVLTHGRKNSNIFSKVGGGLFSLYNSVNVFSDILSYSRILALSLSTAIIGMVMNTLAEMLQGSIIGIAISVLVYLVGHAFNLAMGLLSAYVHDSRLQYIEFFGIFYEGGGVQFKPLSMNLKHIDKIEKVEI